MSKSTPDSRILTTYDFIKAQSRTFPSRPSIRARRQDL